MENTVPKPINDWIKDLPNGEFKTNLFDVLQEKLGIVKESMGRVVDFAYLVVAWEPNCPYWFGASMYFDGITPPAGIPENDMAYTGYKAAKSAMEGQLK